MIERSDNARDQCRYQTNSKMSENDLGLKKTLIVLVIVVACFAVLWPKVLYPMLIGPANQRMKPNKLDKGCCDVISDIDVNTIKIMNELCNTIVQDTKEKPLKGQAVIEQCRKEIFNKCGIDISAILKEQILLGRSFKQIVDEVRSYNGSLCLKYQFGISPWRLGASHRITINLSSLYVRQERPSHLRPEMLHPALRERGSAIVQPYQQPAKPGHPRFVEGRPGPVPGVRPPMGGAGHMVHSPKTSNSMGVIMPIYTVGIVIFFSYTLMKLLFKKKPEGPGAPLYPPVEPSETFRKEVFEAQKRKAPQGGPLIVNAMTALLDEVDQELEARRKAREVTSQKEDILDDQVLANGSAKHLAHENDQPSVKILGMEMTASCEGGHKWDRSESPVIPKPNQTQVEPSIPLQEIYLEGTLPAQSHLLVADSTVEEETNSVSSSTDPPVILASKMTLSVISLDAPENGKESGRLPTLEDVEESKYTTASEATVADCEISDEEENDIEEDHEKVTKNKMDTVEQQQNNVDEFNIEQDEEIESIEKSQDNFVNEPVSDFHNTEVLVVERDDQSVETVDHFVNEQAIDLNNAEKSVSEFDINKGEDKENIGTEDNFVNIHNTEEPLPECDVQHVEDKETTSEDNVVHEAIHNVVESVPEFGINQGEEESKQSFENKPVLNNEGEEPVPESDVQNGDDIENIERSEDGSLNGDSEEEIEDIDRSEDNSLEDMEIEEIIIYEDDDDDIDFENDIEHKFGNRISPDTVENIGNIIDEIITDGALRLENENDLILGNFRHSTEDSTDNCDNVIEEEENYNNNNEPSLDQNENTFEHDAGLNQTQSETHPNVEGTDLLSTGETLIERDSHDTIN